MNLVKVENTPGVPRTDSLSWTRSTPLSSQVLTPPMSEERNGRSYSIPDLSSANDIMSEFYRQGFPVLSQHILSFLNPAEIATACLVCRSWRDIIHNLPAVRRKLQDYRARKKVLGQENVPVVLPQTGCYTNERSACSTVGPSECHPPNPNNPNCCRISFPQRNPPFSPPLSKLHLPSSNPLSLHRQVSEV